MPNYKFVHRETGTDVLVEVLGFQIQRLSAACEANGMNYNRLIEGLRKAGVALNRKMLSEIAIHDPQGFVKIAELAKAKVA